MRDLRIAYFLRGSRLLIFWLRTIHAVLGPSQLRGATPSSAPVSWGNQSFDCFGNSQSAFGIVRADEIPGKKIK